MLLDAFTFNFSNLREQSLGRIVPYIFEKQTNKQTILSSKNKTKISLEMVRHKNDVHNSSTRAVA